jgi:hypothetical protein
MLRTEVNGMRFDPEMQRVFFDPQALEVFALVVIAWLFVAAVVVLVPLLIAQWSESR